MRIAVLAALLWFASVIPCGAYSVLAHEAAVDAAWDAALLPLLKTRYPQASAAELNTARGFAYGGSLIQDMGYYPFGSKLFSHLLHYVRTGDFVEALIREANDVYELGFALGALAHYADDNQGHPAVNRVVAQTFPKLRKKFGESVTYLQSRKHHIMVEFSFDVVEVAAGVYQPNHLRQAIGFEVSRPLLERAFEGTYGLKMADLFENQERAVATFRYAVSQVVPALTRAAWREKRKEIEALLPNIDRDAFLFEYSPGDFEREYGDDYQRPTGFIRFLTLLYRILPKIGPLRPLRFTPPTPQTEAMFLQSFRDAGTLLRAAVEDIDAGRLDLPNTNFDTGRSTPHYGDYALADETYAELLHGMARRNFAAVPPALAQDVLDFYGPSPSPAGADARSAGRWAVTLAALSGLRQAAR